MTTFNGYGLILELLSWFKFYHVKPSEQ